MSKLKNFTLITHFNQKQTIINNVIRFRQSTLVLSQRLTHNLRQGFSTEHLSQQEGNDHDNFNSRKPENRLLCPSKDCRLN